MNVNRIIYPKFFKRLRILLSVIQSSIRSFMNRNNSEIINAMGMVFDKLINREIQSNCTNCLAPYPFKWVCTNKNHDSNVRTITRISIANVETYFIKLNIFLPRTSLPVWRLIWLLIIRMFSKRSKFSLVCESA